MSRESRLVTLVTCWEPWGRGAAHGYFAVEEEYCRQGACNAAMPTLRWTHPHAVQVGTRVWVHLHTVGQRCKDRFIVRTGVRQPATPQAQLPMLSLPSTAALFVLALCVRAHCGAYELTMKKSFNDHVQGVG